MRILILGAGRAGRSVAHSLTDGKNDITVVDLNVKQIEELQRKLDLRGLVGDASSPDVLIEAGIEDADLLIAVTASDETNLVASLLAAKLFNVPTRIARVRKNDLSHYPKLLAEEGFQVTKTIWPEAVVVRTLTRLIEFPDVLQLIELGNAEGYLVTLEVPEKSPWIGDSLKIVTERIKSPSVGIVAIFRAEKFVSVTSATKLEANDEIIVFTDKSTLHTAINTVRPQGYPVKNLILGGDTVLALKLAQALNEKEDRYNIKVIDWAPKSRLTQALETPKNTLLIEGSITDEETLLSNGIAASDIFIALNRDDKTNIISSLLAKKLGAKHVIAQVDNPTFSGLVQSSAIDVIVSSTQAILDELLMHVRQGDVVATHQLCQPNAEVLEVIARGTEKTSRVVGRAVDTINLPSGVSIAGVIRKNDQGSEVLATNPSLSIQTDDRVIVFISKKSLIATVEKLFAVDIGFF